MSLRRMFGGHRFEGGWLDDPEARRQFRDRFARPMFRQNCGSVQGSGRGIQVLLWKFYELVTGTPFTARFQELGDCVGQAAGLGVDTLSTTQIAMHGRKELWKGPCSTELIYAGSRVEIGGGRIRGDGSNGSWAAQWLLKGGTLPRDKYGNIDLTTYRPDLAKAWGRPGAGVPDELEPLAFEHLVRTATIVEGWEEACDAVGNGFPVLVCSSPGYSLRTDSEGFVSRRRKPMRHAWLLWGVDSLSKRQGGALCTSWGDCVRGTKHPLGAPEGTLWVDAREIDKMLAQGDSYALSNFDGYPYQQETLRYKLF
jgi:hypothetical protein